MRPLDVVAVVLLVAPVVLFALAGRNVSGPKFRPDRFAWFCWAVLIAIRFWPG